MAMGTKKKTVIECRRHCTYVRGSSHFFARIFNTVVCTAEVVVDIYGLPGTWYQMRSGCQVGLRRLLQGADFISAPLSGSKVPNGMGPQRGQSTKWEQGTR